MSSLQSLILDLSCVSRTWDTLVHPSAEPCPVKVVQVPPIEATSSWVRTKSLPRQIVKRTSKGRIVRNCVGLYRSKEVVF